MASNQFNSTANTSWTCPHNGTYIVTCWGPGGGGATYGRTTNAHGGGGGGGGAYARSVVTCVKDTVYTIAVGGGGAGATSNNSNGSNGTANSHFNNNEVRAAFGLAGNRSGAGGAGGTVANSVGTGRNAGGAGAGNAAMVGGGGGAAGSSAGTGPAGENGTPPNGGAGNNGAGSGGSGGASNTSGSIGSIPGGGGGGAGGNLGTTVKTGADGANGSVLIQWNDFIDGATAGGGANTVSGVLHGHGKLYGATNTPPAATVSGTLIGKAKGYLYGATDGTCTPANAGTLTGKGKLYGTIDTSHADVSGNLTEGAVLPSPIAGATDGVALVGGTLSGKGKLITYTLGSELITNGDFDTDTDWDKETGWSIHDGKAYSAGSNGFGRFQPSGACPLTSNFRYLLEYDQEHTDGQLKFIESNIEIVLSYYGTAHVKFKFNHDTVNHYWFQAWASWVGTLDNVSVKQVSDFVQGVAIVSGTLMGRGSLRNGGKEMIANGTFDSDTLWEKDSGWTINGGVAIYDGIGDNYLKLSNANMLYPLQTYSAYIISFWLSTIKEYFYINTYGGGIGLIPTATYPSGVTSRRIITGDSVAGGGILIGTFDPVAYSMDNISITEITGGYSIVSGTLTGKGKLQNTCGKEKIPNGTFGSDTIWEKTGGWGIADGVATRTGDTGNLQIPDSGLYFPMQDNTYYRFIVGTLSPAHNLTILSYDGASSYYATSDEVTSIDVIVKPDPTIGVGGIRFLSPYGSTFSIDNVSVVECMGVAVVSGTLTGKGTLKGATGVGSEKVTNGTFDSDTGWTKNTNVTISDGKAHLASPPDWGNCLEQSVGGFTIGKSYRLYIEVLELVSGSVWLQPWLGGTQGPEIAAVGKYKFTIYQYAATGFFDLQNGASSNFHIDNISICEVVGSSVSGTLIGKGLLRSYGREAIFNGGFSNGTGWAINGSSITISGNKLNYDDVNDDHIEQADADMEVSIALSTKYRIKFEIDIVSGFVDLYFLNSTGTIAYIARSDTYIDGINKRVFTSPESWTGESSGISIYIYNSASNPFTIDDFSLKALSGWSTVSGNLTSAAAASAIAGATDGVALVGGTLRGRGELQSMTLGAEIVQNCTLDDDSWWTVNAGCTVTEGVARCSNSQVTPLYRANCTEEYHTYRFKFQISNYVDGGVEFYGGYGRFSANGICVGHFYCEQYMVHLGFSATWWGWYLDLDNIHVNEITGFQTNGVATVSGTLTGKGKLVTYTLGSELVTNGGFDSSSGWTYQTSPVQCWTIGGGKASYNWDLGENSWIGRESNPSLTAGTRYKLSTVVSSAVGNTQISWYIGYFTQAIGDSYTSGNGTSFRYGKCNGDCTGIVLIAMYDGCSGDFSIDDVSAKALTDYVGGVASVSGTLKGKGTLCSLILGTDIITNGSFSSDTWWSKSPGVVITDGVARWTNINNSGYGVYGAGLVIGNRYRVRWQVLNYVTGTLVFHDGTSWVGGQRNANGVYNNIFVSTGQNPWISVGIFLPVTADADNVSVYPVTGFHATGVATVSGTLTGKGALSSLTLGAQKVSNGTFEDDSVWTITTGGWSIVEGTPGYARYLDTVNEGIVGQSGANMISPIEDNHRYRMQFNMSISSGTAEIGIYSHTGAHQYIDEASYAAGILVFHFSSTTMYGNTGIGILGRTESTTYWDISNILLQEAEITVIGSSVVSGNLTSAAAAETLEGAINGVADVSGTLKANGKLYSSADGVSLVSGNLTGKGSLSGVVNAPFIITEDFQDYNTGTILGQKDWVTCYGTSPNITDFSGDKRVTPASGGESCARKSTTISGNHFAQIKLESIDTLYLGVAVRCQGSGATADYYAYYSSSGERYLGRVINGAWVNLGSAIGAISIGDVFRLEIHGNTIKAYRNGVIDSALSGGGIYTDDNITGGTPGIAGYMSGTTISGDDFISGAFAVSGILKGKGNLLGASSGISNVSGTLHGHGKLYGSTDGVATVSGALNSEGGLTGNTDGVALVSGTLKAKGKLYGATDGVSLLSGSLHGHGKLYGATDGIALVGATLTPRVWLYGVVDGVALVGAALHGHGKLYGATDGIASLWGTMKVGQVLGVTGGVAVVSGSLHGHGRLYGSTDGVAVVGGTIRAKGKLYGLTSGVTTVSGTLRGKLTLSGSTAGIALLSGILHAKGTLVASTSGVALLGGVLGGKGDLSGEVVTYASLTATLIGTGALAGNSDGIATVSARVSYPGMLLGETGGIATVSGTIKSFIYAAGSINGVASVSGEMWSYILGEIISGNSLITLEMIGNSLITSEIEGNSLITSVITDNSLII